MDNNDANKVENVRKLAELRKAKKKILQHPWRQVGSGENNWSPAWLALIGQMISDVVKFGKMNDEDSNNIDYLVKSNLIDFRCGENPCVLSFEWTSDDWLTYLEYYPKWMVKIYEKCAPVLKLQINIDLVTTVLKLVHTNITCARKFAIDVIRIAFSKTEALVSYEVKFLAIQSCRFKTFLGIQRVQNAHLYIDFWRTLYQKYPERNLDFSTKMLTGHDIEKQSAEDMNRVQPTDTIEIYILEISLRRKNVILESMNGDMIPYKIAMLKFWESLKFHNLHEFFHPQTAENSLLDLMFTTIGKVVDDREPAVQESVTNLILKLCRHLENEESPRLKQNLEGLRGWLLSPERHYLVHMKLALQIHNACGDRITPIPPGNWITPEMEWTPFDYFFTQLLSYNDDLGDFYDVAILYYKVKYPENSFEIQRNNLDELNSLLGYGLESFKGFRAKLPKRHTYCMADIYNLDYCNPKSLSIYKERYMSTNFGGIKWTHESYPCFLNVLSSLIRSEIGCHLDEFEKPEKYREFFQRGGPPLFEYSLYIGLTIILKTLEDHRKLFDSHIQVEGAEPMKTFNQRLKYDRFDTLVVDEMDTIMNGMSETVSKFLNGQKDDLDKYFIPIMDIVTLSTEVYNISEDDEVFEKIYVPIVKALLPFYPHLAIKFITAFSRTKLRLNLLATYPKTLTFKREWQKIRDQKTPEYARNFFQKRRATMEEVYGESAPYVLNEHENFLMNRYVAVIVNEHELYDCEEVADYLVIVHHFNTLREQRVGYNNMEDMSDKDIQDILYPNGYDDDF